MYTTSIYYTILLPYTPYRLLYRFPIDIKYAEDLASPSGGNTLPSNISNLAREVVNSTKNCSKDMVPLNVTKQQYMLAVALVKNLGQLG